MFGPLTLTRHRSWSATTPQVTTRWTLTAAGWTWQLAYTRPGRDTDQAGINRWGWT